MNAGGSPVNKGISIEDYWYVQLRRASCSGVKGGEVGYHQPLPPPKSHYKAKKG